MAAGETGSMMPEPQSVAGDGKGKPSSTPKKSITELELQFAQNPESDAYFDLCEAYLEQGRFMEAMVVCKKGIKARPDVPDPRILLARVYGAQKKYKRALQELDELAQAQPNKAVIHLARAKMRIEGGEDAGVVDDLKKAVDLDPKLAEASQLLAARGIVYPEPPPAPVAPPPPSIDLNKPTGDLPAPPPRLVSFVQPMVDPATGGASGIIHLSGLPGMEGGPGIPVSLPRGVSMVPGAMTLPPGGFQIIRQKLEGEEELENLANKVAEEKPAQGSPKTFLLISLVGVLVLLMAGGLLFFRKHKQENIGRLLKESERPFNRDTYGSYKQTASFLEEVINQYDDKQAKALGWLAYTYAILWAEHGETSLKPKLDTILARAEKYAPDVSYTVAARGLAAMYDGKDRLAAGEKARQALDPMIRKTLEGGAAPTHANLTLAIVEMETGAYDAAVRGLGVVKDVLPGSVRAQVWHARAAYRAGRLGTARASFEQALRAEPNHPGALAGLALVKLESGDLNGAINTLVEFDKLAREQPKEISTKDTALADFARSEIARSAGDEARAAGAYDAAVRLDPENADFPFGLGRWLRKNERAKEALEPLKKAAEMEPTRYAFRVELAEAQMELGDNAAAEANLQIARQKAPDYVPAALSWARLLRRTNRPEAETFIRELLTKHPSYAVSIKLELGRFLRAKERLDEARQTFEEAIGSMGSASAVDQGEILLSYGRLMDDRGDRVVAAKSYKEAANLGMAEGWYRHSIILAKGATKEERDEAKKSCERYLAAGSSLRYSKPAKELCDSL